ncbi:MAG: hypothetical protein LC134_06700 [Chitinophagales bacterium]|nr:hypothetical protein [Chitinophagales bacterium]
MKILFLTATLFLSTILFAQETESTVQVFQISAQDNTLRAYSDGSSNKSVLVLKKNINEQGKFVIIYSNTRVEKNIKREYYIADENGKELRLRFLTRVIGISHIYLKDLFVQTNAGNTYSLFTRTTTTDNEPVIQNVLLCKIEVR